MRVLLVDDSPDMRYMLRAMCEDAGMDVEEAGSAIAAARRLLSSPGAPAVDVVVLDQRMPDMTGLELARSLRRRGSRPQLVLFSAYLHPTQEAEAQEIGVTVVDKSDLHELVAVVRGLLAAQPQL